MILRANTNTVRRLPLRSDRQHPIVNLSSAGYRRRLDGGSIHRCCCLVNEDAER